ncbi:hypothetical protein E2C01_028509 [Portunus trituberculatus]|uniref:Uncharacterized protein n=1 Tax=Portunus trituberculatus TaxID=210409 RepID=A0A5B7EP95_PORTR|nr:hypothetical protein [Portunus trituberculatus]
MQCSRLSAGKMKRLEAEANPSSPRQTVTDEVTGEITERRTDLITAAQAYWTGYYLRFDIAEAPSREAGCGGRKQWQSFTDLHFETDVLLGKNYSYRGNSSLRKDRIWKANIREKGEGAEAARRDVWTDKHEEGANRAMSASPQDPALDDTLPVGPPHVT